jgi:hypothetical protein
VLVATRTYAGLPVKRGLKMMRSRQRGSMGSHGTCSSDHDKIDYQEWDAGTGEHCVRGRVSPRVTCAPERGGDWGGVRHSGADSPPLA